MKYVNDFGIAPTRGTLKSVGIDFYMPDASRWCDKEYELFYKYLDDNNLSSLKQYIAGVDDINEKVKVHNALLLFLSWDRKGKEIFSEYKNTLLRGVLTLQPTQSICVPTGIRTMFTPGYCGIFFNKSGRGREGLVVKAQVIDEDYTGYVHINLVNTSDHPVNISIGQKLSQLIELPAIYDEPVEMDSEEYFAQMNGTERGEGAFGHTDNK